MNILCIWSDLGTISVPGRELLLRTTTDRHELCNRGSYPGSSLSAFQQSDYFLNSVLAVSFCIKSFSVSSLVLRMAFLLFPLLVNRVSGYIYASESKSKLMMYSNFWNVLLECVS